MSIAESFILRIEAIDFKKCLLGIPLGGGAIEQNGPFIGASLAHAAGLFWRVFSLLTIGRIPKRHQLRTFCFFI